METQTYNKVYLKELLFVLRDDLKDLDKWSIHNDDAINDEVNELKKLLDKINEKTID